MGRFDALVAVISGTTLTGFVGLVVYAVLVAVGVLNGGTAVATDAAGYGAGAVDPAVEGSTDVTYPRREATVDGERVAYLDFGDATPLTDDGAVAVAPIWVFIDGFEADGRPQMSSEHPTIVDVVPGDPGYSDLWDVQFVIVPEGFEGDLRSIEDLNASGLTTVPSGMLVNCPLVEADATSSEGHSARAGWYRGEQIHYFDLGVTTTAPGDVYEFVTNNPLGYGGANLVPVPPLMVLPEDDGPAAQFFRLRQVTVSGAAQAAEVGSYADLVALDLDVRETGELVNRPLVTE